ncbi:MAG TPA: HD domain-containing phosphohydrolase [Gemmataceae bacterium]|jgi:HD-GYP domain-containing protein (c-di-GMP phosphodiesterase class II)|nr:HD domain-containing phosphohydrolase [Gemmataceae bacterium]
MSDTRVLLQRITALRQRLNQAQGMLQEAGAAAAHLLAAPKSPNLTEKLEEQVTAGARVQALLDGSLRQIAGVLDGEDGVRPTQLTTRVRRLLERGRDLVQRLRSLAEDPAMSDDMDDPLVQCVRSATAMLESSMRFVQAFPDAPSAQLRLSEGLDGILAAIADRIGGVAAAVIQRRQDGDRIDTLAQLLAGLAAGSSRTLDPFTALAEAVVADARQGKPMRLLDAGPAKAESGWLARHAAAHSLTVAQVVARLVRHDSETPRLGMLPVLAALLHDAGMVTLDPEAVAHPDPLSDAQRRIVERHPQAGAELVARHIANAGALPEHIRTHHERLDGSGYPAGLRAQQIGPLARLLAVADVYAALSCERLHRHAVDPRTALTDTLMLAERGALDRAWAERLLNLSFYPVGTVVELTDGSIGRVMATHLPRGDVQTPARPVVALVKDPQGHWLPTPQALDLSEAEGRAVVRALPARQRRKLLGERYPQWAA